MNELIRAIADIDAIRGQIARSTQFRGYGPAAHLFASGVAVAAAFIQARWMPDPASHVDAYLALWIFAAALAIGAIGVEKVARATRENRSLARSMLNSAFEQFVPSVAAGVLSTAVLYRCAAQCLWMLPGLWQLFFSLGAFATGTSVPAFAYLRLDRARMPCRLG